jgi:hypothetical protein
MSIGMNVVGLLELVHVVVEVGSSIDNKERREHQQQSSESSGHPGEFVDGPQYPRVQLLSLPYLCKSPYLCKILILWPQFKPNDIGKKRDYI